MSAETFDDFWAYKPTGQFIYEPTGELWVPASINASLPRIPLVDKDSKPLVDKKGNPKTMAPSVWLARNRPVQQMAWAPGEPVIIRDRLMRRESGWVERKGAATFNLYRRPPPVNGNPKDVGPWLKHVHGIYPESADYIIMWLAHRVQRPEEKINHSIVLIGYQGIGKDSLLEPVKYAIGAWNFAEVSPGQATGRFNEFLARVILRVNEARDEGDLNRFQFYEHMKGYQASPPDVLHIDGKFTREYNIINCVAIIITTNHIDGLYLPPDDRRHYVAASEKNKDQFPDVYWDKLYHWYQHEGGNQNVAAYLAALDISDFKPKAPPPKTAAWWAVVDSNRPTEEAELADALDKLGNPNAITMDSVIHAAGIGSDFERWMSDRRNRRLIPHRFNRMGYVPVRNDGSTDGLWAVDGKRQVAYAKNNLTPQQRHKAISVLKDEIEAAAAKAAAARNDKKKTNGPTRGVRF